jgi:hypothetical protein
MLRVVVKSSVPGGTVLSEVGGKWGEAECDFAEDAGAHLAATRSRARRG